MHGRKYIHIIYICVASLLLLTSCGLSGSSFRIKGSFRDMQTGELYIYNLSDNHARLDTLTIQEGRFLYRGEADEVTPYVLVFPNGVEQVIFVGPAADVEYEASANDLKNYVVKGTEENELMNQFRQETYTLNPSQVVGTARTYIKDHPLSQAAIYLFDHYFVQNEEASGKETSELLKVLKAKHPHNHYLLNVESKLADAEQRQVGKKLPNVTLTKKDLSTVKLWSKQKDYHLVAFWSTWMQGGYDVLWRLRRSHEKYKESGKLRTVAISLDIERFRWEQTTAPDSTNLLEHYCDGLSFESKAVKSLGIESLPYYILTDKDHKVLEEGDNIQKLDEVLEKYLK